MVVVFIHNIVVGTTVMKRSFMIGLATGSGIAQAAGLEVAQRTQRIGISVPALLVVCLGTPGRERC